MPENPHPFSKIAGILLPLIVVVLSKPMSMRPHGLQQARLLCPPLSPGVCSNSCLWSWWCYLTISSSCHPILLLPSLFPSIRIFSNESALRIWWPKYWSFSSFSLACEITHPYKNWQPYILVPLVFQDGLHSIYGVYFSLNKPSFTLVKFSLEFFPMWSQEPILGSSPRDSAMTWDVTILLHPTLFPAIVILLNMSAFTFSMLCHYI